MLTAVLVIVAGCVKDEPINIPSNPEPYVIKCVKPAYLKEGDKVALISPSYHTPMENVEKTAAVLTGWGLVPVIGQNVDSLEAGRYAGTVAQRVSDLLEAVNNPEIKAIICNRGGYGTIQLIDHIPLGTLTRNPKWIVGFSDISTLHGLWSRAGVMSIHGTMSSFLAAGGTDATSTLMRDLLMGNLPAYEVPAHPQNIPGKASGVQIGKHTSELQSQ